MVVLHPNLTYLHIINFFPDLLTDASAIRGPWKAPDFAKSSSIDEEDELKKCRFSLFLTALYGDLLSLGVKENHPGI